MTAPTATPPSGQAGPANSGSSRFASINIWLSLLTAILAFATAILGFQKNEAVETVQRKTNEAAALEDRVRSLEDRIASVQGENGELTTENSELRSQLGLPNAVLGANAQMYLSDVDVVDYNKEADTGSWDAGARTINQTQYGHSIGMNAGCQNGDGGDFWLDYSLDGSWKTLEVTIGVSDRSSTQSTATYKVIDAVSGAELGEGAATAGPPLDVAIPISDVTRLRLFINDPNAPNQACGFEDIETAVVWGDATLLKS